MFLLYSPPTLPTGTSIFGSFNCRFSQYLQIFQICVRCDFFCIYVPDISISQVPVIGRRNVYIYFYLFIFFIASKTHTEKKLHRINKLIKRKTKTKKANSEFTHLHGNILTNIKLSYSSANSIYYIILS